MTFRRMPLEIWFDEYQYQVEHDIGESGMKFLTLAELDFSLDDVDLRYGHHLGSPELRAEIAKMYNNRTWDNVAVTTGGSEANFCIIAHLVGPKDHIIVEHPTYPSLFEVPRSLGREMTFLKLDWDNEWKPDLDALRKLVKPNTKLITLTHPNNPTGSVIDGDTMKEAYEIAIENDAYLLVDETYRELSFDNPPPRAATLGERAITLTSMSKTYGLPGIRIGWAVAEESVVQAIRAVREQLTICNSQLGEAIALKVLERREEVLKEIRARMLSNYKVLKDWMDSQEWLEWIEPQSGVVCAPRLKRGGSTDELCKLLVTKYKTFTVPGSSMELDGHLRIGFGGDQEELVEGLAQLKKALKEIHS
jgi:aspartate/methionine/tyrosine aminotransferase